MTADSALVVRRTAWDVVLGILVVIAGLILLTNVVVATAVSVLFMGWMALIAGLVLVVAAFFRLRSGGFWSAALGGAILAVLGLFLLRNPAVGALSLTLMAGALFFASGLTRVVAASHASEARWLLILSGLVSVGLGLWVLFNLGTATLTLLGALVALQTLIEGVTLIVVGRLRPPKEA